MPLIDVRKLRTPQLTLKLNLAGRGGSTAGSPGFGRHLTPTEQEAGIPPAITPADAEQLAKEGTYVPPGDGAPPPAEDVDLAHSRGFGHEDGPPPEEEPTFWDEHGTKVIVGGVVAAGLVAAGLAYWFARKKGKASKARPARKLKRRPVLRRNAAPIYYVQCQGPQGFEEWSESRTLSQAKAKAAKALHLTGQPCRIIEASGWRTRLVAEVR